MKENDPKQIISSYKNYTYILQENYAYGYNGYVILPPSHLAILESVQNTLSVHGGITYYNQITNTIGFDTCHSQDVVSIYNDECCLDWSCLRDMEYTIREIEFLIDQLIGLEINTIEDLNIHLVSPNLEIRDFARKEYLKRTNSCSNH